MCGVMQPFTLDAPTQQAALPFVVLDADGRVLALNAAMERIVGQPVAALCGQSFTSLVDAFSREKAAMMVAATLERGAVSDWELNHAQPSGPPLLVSYHTWTWRMPPDDRLALAAMGQPLQAALSLTAQLAATNQQLEGALLQLERTHKELKDAQAQLVRLEKMRALGQLVAGVAHEVNTPLAFVANNLEFLSDVLVQLRALHERYHSLVDAEQGQRLAAAAAEADVEQLWADIAEVLPESREGLSRIASIVQALRAFARPDDPGQQAADLAVGFAGTVRIARAAAPNGVTIHEAYAPLPRIVCNPGQINQVVLNLLTNAVQAVSATGHVTLRTQQEGVWAVVSVSDDGVGMDETTLARLGEPFFTTRPLGSGTGLGLAISRGIAERHGGRLEFTSSPGQGTTARLLLPLT
ncbi:MAG: PAS domain-containing protein [Candidatus Viridilinea halotolerans]|uniref:histidine kinase n=1 Tax=Candidatus Viridilinea halotolerans TaxID=2491704 RepID=A0A426TSA4_9CHLR|nr:MAG: PAS domain-containing protein [Candidatus Viridilinea halotolerans]